MIPIYDLRGQPFFVGAGKASNDIAEFADTGGSLAELDESQPFCNVRR